MKKAILTLGALWAASVSFSAVAEEMVRYEDQYYKSGQTEIPFEAQNERQKRYANPTKVGTVIKDKKNHPLFAETGLLKDR